MAEFGVLVLAGDGIGPEVTAEGVRALEAVGRRFGHTFRTSDDLVGGAAIDAHGVAIRPVCINQSRWDCTLEPTGTDDRFAVRLGLRWRTKGRDTMAEHGQVRQSVIKTLYFTYIRVCIMPTHKEDAGNSHMMLSLLR